MTKRFTRRQFLEDGALSAVAVAGNAGLAFSSSAADGHSEETSRILDHNPQMEYRRLGKTGMMLSAVGLGGHWKQLDAIMPGLFDTPPFLRKPQFVENRAEVVSRCIDRGINYVDACTADEVCAYAKALRGRRDKMWFGYSWSECELSKPEWRTIDALKKSLDHGLKSAGLECFDLWRMTCMEQSGQHSDAERDAMFAAFDWAKKSGRARFVGVASHDRLHLKRLIQEHGDGLDVVLMPYTAGTKVIQDPVGIWAAIQKHNIGCICFKPFACTIKRVVGLDGTVAYRAFSIFKADGKPGNPHYEEDNRVARLALRYALLNPAVTATIPGMLTVAQVDNAALAVAERRELDGKEKAELGRAMERVWAGLPSEYQWLKDWKYV